MKKIEIENLTFTYPQKTAPALRSVNIAVNAGEFVVLCGKSGCGKSTLLRQLKPLLSPYGKRSGRVLFDGEDIMCSGQRQQAENIGFVMQNPDSQIVCDKVWHELSFGLESLSVPSGEIRARVAEMAAFFGIQDWFYRNVCELSGGQKQLLNLASVMVCKPSVLILDEPTSQLDPIAAHDFLNTLSRINRELGTTIILSEHRLEEALPLADRAIVMDDGSVIADADVRSVGRILKEKNHDMLLALPTPMRVSYSVKSRLDTPITVRDARIWLSKMPIDSSVAFTDNEPPSERTVLKLKDLWLRYERNGPDILKGTVLKIYEKEFYAIVGGNGVGKSTLLSAIMGGNKPYRGRLEIGKGKKAVCLPQNPQALFVKDTVLADLWDILQKSTDPKAVKEEKIRRVTHFCGLDGLLNSHPYDLSGGEQQRAALAKVLLCEPDILLLDEPTKGLDAHFKIRLAKMLKSLQKSGVTIVMVSHDIEFSAKYADRLGMFFDGQIVSEDKPRTFFSGKSFYTTAANRMARDVRRDAVLAEDVIAMVGGTQPSEMDDLNDFTQKKPCTPLQEKPDTNVTKERQKLSKRTVGAAITILLLIPLTIYIGYFHFGDRRYYFTSLLIMLEAMLPFALIFEGRKPQARELVIISVLCAIAVAGRVAFAALPHFKPVIALIIVAGVCFGGETGFLVGSITAFVSNFYFSQGPWTVWQMFAFGITGFLSGVLFQKGLLRRSRTWLVIYGFSATLIICGIILNTGSALMVQGAPTPQLLLATIAAGLPMDLLHALSTVFFLWVAAKPFISKLERIKLKYGLIE